jgi:predicted RNA-binding Zn-ribbon protein involved in translation (DUF1610 family)
MTATDELLTILKEHGVEHYEHEAPATDCIAFFDGNGWHDCWESVDGEVNVTFSMTPEQAIAATLGAGTCHNNAPAYLDFLCSECGFVHYHSDTNDTGDGNEWHFCPNCGREVVTDGQQ